MEFSELTNKELKGILRENQVKNYSNLNKKELIKKVNNLIKVQNGGKSGKGKNGKKKKYTLKDLIGGNKTPEIVVNSNNLPLPPPPPVQATSQNKPPLYVQATSKNTLTLNDQSASQNTLTLNDQAASQNTPRLNVQAASAPVLNKNEIKKIENSEEQRQINEATRLSLENKVNNKGKNECGACSIL